MLSELCTTVYFLSILINQFNFNHIKVFKNQQVPFRSWVLTFFLFSFLGASAQGVLKIHQYQLPNGLTVILNEDHSTPEVFGLVVVKAGGKTTQSMQQGWLITWNICSLKALKLLKQPAGKRRNRISTVLWNFTTSQEQSPTLLKGKKFKLKLLKSRLRQTNTLLPMN